MPVTMAWALMLAAGFAIQPPGQFHAGEPIARDGERWQALRVMGDRASLVATTLSVLAVPDALVDEAGARTGLAVSSADDEGVVAYLRGGSLRARAIEPAAVAARDPLAPGLPYDLVFRGRSYRLSSQCEARPRHVQEGQPQHACRIELLGDGQRQVLSSLGGYREPGATTMSLGDDASPALVFAGDLDDDGRLDLIFNTTDHYNVSRPTLFLSSQAAPGEMLREVAHYQSVGC